MFAVSAVVVTGISAEFQVSEKALDYKIWQTLFGREIPYKPTYLPNTKLARLVRLRCDAYRKCYVIFFV